MHKTVTVIDPIVWPAEQRNEEIIKEFEELWTAMEFGNDDYYFCTNLSSLEKQGTVEDYSEYLPKMPKTIEYIKANDISGPIMLHYWW